MNQPNMEMWSRRYQDLVEDGERAARYAVRLSLPPASESVYRKAARWLNARWAYLAQRLHVPNAAAAVGKQTAR